MSRSFITQVAVYWCLGVPFVLAVVWLLWRHETL